MTTWGPGGGVPGRGAAAQGSRGASMLVTCEEKRGANCGCGRVSQRGVEGSEGRKVTGRSAVSRAVG